MVYKFISNLKKSEKGITLIEIIVSIAIITILSMMVIADFPKILRDFALSRAVYKMSQDIRKTEDLGLSGVQIAGQNAVAEGGYGVYVDTTNPKQYLIYADNCQPVDYEYTPYGNGAGCPDFIVETIDISKEEPGVSIKEIDVVDGSGNITQTGLSSASINFTPPNPETTITADGNQESGVEVVFGLDLDPSITRTVSINSSGLVQVK